MISSVNAPRGTNKFDFWASYDYGNNDFDGRFLNGDADVDTIAAGGDIKVTPHLLVGAAATFAQNKGDFDAYDALYAREFHGVKRAGNRTAAFDRTGWMRDRKTMFRKPISVRVTDPRVTGNGPAWRVTFRQAFAVGSFHDEGMKELELRESGGLVRIVREEMLASKRLRPPEGWRPLPAEQLSYVVAERTREIGVRMALGATAAGVQRLVVTQGTKVVLIGATLGAAAALASTRLLDALLYEVSAVDPVVFVAMSIVRCWRTRYAATAWHASCTATA